MDGLGSGNWPGSALQGSGGWLGRDSPVLGAGGMKAAKPWLDCVLRLLGLALIANHFVKMNEESPAANRVPTEEKVAIILSIFWTFCCVVCFVRVPSRYLI